MFRQSTVSQIQLVPFLTSFNYCQHNLVCQSLGLPAARVQLQSLARSSRVLLDKLLCNELQRNTWQKCNVFARSNGRVLKLGLEIPNPAVSWIPQTQPSKSFGEVTVIFGVYYIQSWCCLRLFTTGMLQIVSDQTGSTNQKVDEYDLLYTSTCETDIRCVGTIVKWYEIATSEFINLPDINSWLNDEILKHPHSIQRAVLAPPPDHRCPARASHGIYLEHHCPARNKA